MTITLWNMFRKRNNSTKQPTDAGVTKDVKLKEGTSYIHPVFILHDNNAAYNYCQFRGRYYFVDEIVSIGNQLSEYHCTVDVLASWKPYIASSQEYVTRAASAYDPDIIDTYYPTKSNAVVEGQVLSTLHGYIVGSGYYVVGVVGGANASSGAINYYAMTADQMKDLLNYMFDITNYNISASEISEDLQKALINPFQYIVSAIWLPSNMPAGTPVHVKFGWWEASGGGNPSGILLGSSDRMELHSTTIDRSSYMDPTAIAQGRNYLNYLPFTKMVLTCYMFGSIPLDPIWFKATNSINIAINIDRFTGIGELILSTSDNGVVYKASAQMGVPVQLAQLTQNLVSSAISGIEGAISIAQGRIASGAAGIASAIESAMPQLATSGSNGSIIAYQVAPSVTHTHYTTTAVDVLHFGRPLCQTKKISSLTGFIMCEDPDIDAPATSYEKDKINDYMSGGFYYE